MQGDYNTLGDPMNEQALRVAADRYREAQRVHEEARTRLYRAIGEAHPAMTYRAIARATGLSHHRIRQIVEARRQRT